MKNKLLLLVMLLCLPSLQARADGVASLTPLPKEITEGTGSLALPQSFTISYGALPDSLKAEAEKLAEALSATTGLSVSATADASGALIRMNRYEGTGLKPEGYKLTVTTTGAVAEAQTAAGFFYAFQTIKKLLPANVMAGVRDESVTSYALPVVTITDEPRFPYRGFMLDVARHFYTVDEVKHMLDLMACYKMNRFHWHLSDDQGWRAEIKRWPKLTSVGSIAPNSYQWDWTYGGYYTNKPYGPLFYTQEEMKDVVDYAKKLHIEVIPEIDMPGHFVAAMTAYPEFSCTPYGSHQNWIPWGVSTDVLNVANPAAVQFAKDILDELTDIFPYEYIHIGGDECPTSAWEGNAECQAKMEKEGMTSSRQLQSHFIREMAEFIQPKGHKLIVWNEAITAGNADLDVIKETGATVMCWTGPEEASRKAAQLGLNNVMTPYYYYYVNRKQKQDASWMTVAGDGNDDLQRTYDYQPVPSGVSAAQQAYYQGVQGTFWTEHVNDITLVEYLALPRLMAIAETGWSPQAKKDFSSFCRRMAADTVMLRLGGYRYSPHYLTETGESSMVLPKASDSETRYYYRLVTRATGDRLNRCIELLAEGSPLIAQYADKQAAAGRLWSNAQAEEGAANYDCQLWAFEADPAGSGKYALVCKAKPEGSLNAVPTAYSNTGRWTYDEAGKHYNFRLGTTRYGQDGDHFYYSIYNDANDAWSMSIAASGQGYSINLWNQPADGGNGSDWKCVPAFSDMGSQLSELASRANDLLAHGATYAEGETPAPGKFSAVQMDALRSLTVGKDPSAMNEEEQAAYAASLADAIEAVEATRGRLENGQTYRVANAVEGFEGLAFDDRGNERLTYTGEALAADAWTVENAADDASGNETFRLRNAATGRYIAAVATAATGYTGYGVTMGTSGITLTAAYDAAHGDYAVKASGKTLFPVPAGESDLSGTVAAGSNGNQSGDAVRLQGNAWMFAPVCLVTYVCRDEQGTEIARFHQSVEKGAAFTAAAPEVALYRLKGYGETGTGPAPSAAALAEPLTVTAVYERAQYAISYELRDQSGAIVRRDTARCNVGETFRVSWPEMPYYTFESTDYEGATEFVPTADLALRATYATEAFNGVASVAEAATAPEAGRTYVVCNTASNLERRGFLNVDPSGGQVFVGSSATGKSPAFVWHFEQSGTGFKVRNEMTGTYIPALASGSAIRLSATGDVFTASAGAQSGTFRFKGSNNLWWNGNVGAFTGWSDGHDFTLYEYIAAPYFEVSVAYVDEAGNALASPASSFVKAGSAYVLVTPAIEGYELTGVTGDQDRLEAVDGNLALAAVYKAKGSSGIRDTEAAPSAPAAIYDLSGRRLQGISAPGLYIVGGKKVMVRKP